MVSKPSIIMSPSYVEYTKEKNKGIDFLFVLSHKYRFFFVMLTIVWTVNLDNQQRVFI